MSARDQPAQPQRNRASSTETVTPGGSFGELERTRYPHYIPGAKYSRLVREYTRSQVIGSPPAEAYRACYERATVNRVAKRPETATCWQRRLYLLAQ